MLPSKPKSGLPETSNNKNTPATPRGKVNNRAASKTESGSPSPLQNPRLSIDRSPRSVDLKPTVERRSPKITTPPDKQPRGAAKAVELQEQLGVAQEELKKAKERLTSVEKENAWALEELKEVKRLACEANDKLDDALVAQKLAEESSEIEKFRAIELEQTSIEAAQKRDEEWQKELEDVRNQHALDVSALLSTTQELQKVKHELAMITDAKNSALSHADDAMKIAEINAEKVELLSGEVNRLKALLDSKRETETNESVELIKKLHSEVEALTFELETAKVAEKKLVEMEALIEGLRIEVTDAKMAEMDAGNLLSEYKRKAELLEVQVEEANQSKISTSESLASAVKQLEECKASLQDSESLIVSLKGKIESLDIEITRHKEDVNKSNNRLEVADKELLEMEKKVEVLKSELQSVEEEKTQALENEKQATSNIQSLLEEKNKLLSELDDSRCEGEKSKKAMEGLASALHEVSTEARESQERLLTMQAEITDAKAHIEELTLALKTREESYKSMLGEARHEIDCLQIDIESSVLEARNSKDEWDLKEINFVNAIQKSEEEIGNLMEEMEKVVSRLKESELDAQAAKDEGAQLLNRLKQAELDATSAKEAAREAKAEYLHLKDRLLDKENELQSISQENDDLRSKEAAALKKVKEFSELLAEATARKEENGELAKSEKEHDILLKSMEVSGNHVDECEAETPKSEVPLGQLKENGREDQKLREENENGNAEPAESVEMNVKMESYNVVNKGSSPEREPGPESVDDEADSKMDTESLDHMNGLSSENLDNGGNSPIKQQQQKKKKPFMRRFGSLLKKNGNQK